LPTLWLPSDDPDALIVVHGTEYATVTYLPAVQELASAGCVDSADEDSRITEPGLDNVCR
jgi:hypothetical protein